MERSDDTEFLQELIDKAKPIPTGVYTITSSLRVSGSGRIIGSTATEKNDVLERISGSPSHQYSTTGATG
jgi:hypothetical protein